MRFLYFEIFSFYLQKMIFFLVFQLAISFNPAQTISSDGNGNSLWAAINQLSGSQDFQINIDPGTYSNWEFICSAKSFDGTLKIHGNGEVIISGGRQIDGWHQDPDNAYTWRANVTSGVKFESLWVNGKRATRARAPSNWTLPTISSFSETNCVDDYCTFTIGIPDDCVQMLSDLSTDELHKINFVQFHGSSTTRGFVQSLNKDSKTLSWYGRKPNENTEKRMESGNYFYLENFKRALNAPGEWFLDESNGYVYYFPRPGESISTIEAIYPVQERLLYCDNSKIIFENIKFIYTGGSVPEKGLSRRNIADDNIHYPMIDLYQASSITFINCTFAHTFGRAFSSYETQDIVVEQCLIEDFGFDGIAFGNSQRTKITNNIIRHGGAIVHHESGIYDNSDPGAEYSYNDISDMIGDGMNICASNGKDAEMLIYKNHVHHIGLNLLDDIGCIYVTDANNINISDNYVHHSGCHTYGAWGIYVDLNCNGIVIKNNLATHTFDGAVHFHYGINNEVVNNIFAYAEKGVVSKGEDQDNQIMVKVYNNIIITKQGSYWCDQWNPSTFEADKNLYWSYENSVNWFNSLYKDFDSWKSSTGKDPNGQYIDPQFNNPEGGDFTFSGTNGYSLIDFMPFDYTTCGVQGSEWRQWAANYNIEDFPAIKDSPSGNMFSEEYYGTVHESTEPPTEPMTDPPTPPVTEVPSPPPTITPTTHPEEAITVCSHGCDYAELSSAIASVDNQFEAVIVVKSGVYTDWEYACSNKKSSNKLTIVGEGDVIVSGGETITGWEVNPEFERSWRAKLSYSIDFDTMWINGKRATRARAPTFWELPTITSVAYDQKSDKYGTYTVGIPSELISYLQFLPNAELSAITIVIFHGYYTTRGFLTSFNRERKTLSFYGHIDPSDIRLKQEIISILITLNVH